jgi:hypothetical protein
MPTLRSRLSQGTAEAVPSARSTPRIGISSFEFPGGTPPYTEYGRAQLAATYTTANRLDVTVVDWAYDTSGGQIPAGDTGTPEPSTFVLTGLATLALGAKGLRVWRASRKTR